MDTNRTLYNVTMKDGTTRKGYEIKRSYTWNKEDKDLKGQKHSPNRSVSGSGSQSRGRISVTLSSVIKANLVVCTFF